MMAQSRRKEKVTEYSTISKTMTKERYNYFLSLIEARESMGSIANLYPDLKWVMLGNRIYDITGLIHPGGQYVWDKLNRRDISRFFAGNYRFEEISSADIRHTHSISALNILDKRYIGSLELNPVFYERKDFETTNFLDGFDHSIDYIMTPKKSE